MESQAEIEKAWRDRQEFEKDNPRRWKSDHKEVIMGTECADCMI